MSIEAMKQALEFVERNTYGGDDVATLITALRTAIEQAEKQEPVAVVSGYYGGQCVVLPTNPSRLFNSGTALYTIPPAAPVQEPLEKRYRFLLGLLIDRGVLTNTRYSNGTWVLQGIYGVDDSGIRGAGLNPEQAIDNAIVAHGLDPATTAKFWQDTHNAITTPPAAQPAVPLTDEWIRSKCKQTWVFETAKQWVRMTEAAHGITGEMK